MILESVSPEGFGHSLHGTERALPGRECRAPVGLQVGFLQAFRPSPGFAIAPRQGMSPEPLSAKLHETAILTPHGHALSPAVALASS